MSALAFSQWERVTLAELEARRLRARLAVLEANLSALEALAPRAATVAVPKVRAPRVTVPRVRAESLEAAGVAGFSETAGRKPPVGSVARILEGALARHGAETVRQLLEWRPREQGGLRVRTVAELEAHEREMQAAGKITDGMRRDFTASGLRGR